LGNRIILDSEFKLMTRILALLAMLLGSLAHADGETPVPIPDQPDLPAPIQSGQPMEPDVTIIRRGEETIEEYRINNQLYRVKITPMIGPSYELVDINGDGNLEVRQGDNQKGMNINKWVLFSW
jgi:hypothetical protein